MEEGRRQKTRITRGTEKIPTETLGRGQWIWGHQIRNEIRCQRQGWGMGENPKPRDPALGTQKWEETKTRGPSRVTESGGEACSSCSNSNAGPKGWRHRSGGAPGQLRTTADCPGSERREAAAARSADPCGSPQPTPLLALRPSPVGRLNPGPLLTSAACLRCLPTRFSRLGLTCPGRLSRRHSRPAGSAGSAGSCQNFSH